MNHDFYVGYVPRAPHDLGTWIRRVAVCLLAGAAATALIFVFAQKPFAAASFDYGNIRTYTGVIRESPLPSLQLDDGRNALLVAPGKHGAGALVRAFDLRSVDLSGSRIQRDGELMIEVVP